MIARLVEALSASAGALRAHAYDRRMQVIDYNPTSEKRAAFEAEADQFDGAAGVLEGLSIVVESIGGLLDQPSDLTSRVNELAASLAAQRKPVPPTKPASSRSACRRAGVSSPAGRPGLSIHQGGHF